MDTNGVNARQLTNGNGETEPRITRDGQWVVYNSTTDWTLWKTPVTGGAPMQLTKTFAREPALSPDGSLIAYNFRDTHASPRWKIAVIPSGGGTPLKVFDRQRAEYQTFELNWTPDGRAITYEANQGGVSNIWSQPLAGGPPQRLSDFTTDYIYGFAWALDRRQIAVVRGAWGERCRGLLPPPVSQRFSSCPHRASRSIPPPGARVHAPGLPGGLS